MRAYLAVLIASALIAPACRSAPESRTYNLQGQVLAVAADRQQATIEHEEIQGLMAAMTMTFAVKDARLLEGIGAGDLVDATLVVDENESYLTALRKVGEAPLEAPAPPPAASSGVELLQPGDPVPDAEFVDQDGRARTFSSFKGSPLAITFIYTSCPIPDFCPLMDRNFAAVQQALDDDPMLRGVHLLSVSFDPLTDTPAVLERHAERLQADPARWTFVTGDRDDIDRFAARFGVSVTRSPDNPIDIAHNLRTVVVDADGRVVTIHTGNRWTPEELVADLKAVAGRP